MIKRKHRLLSKNMSDFSPGEPERSSAISIQKLVYELQAYPRELGANKQKADTSYDRYFKLYNASSTGFVTLSVNEEKILTGNRSAWRKLGINAKELVGRKFSEIILSSDREKFDRYLLSLQPRTINPTLKIKLGINIAPTPESHCKGLSYSDCTPKNCPFTIKNRHIELCGTIIELQNKEKQIILSITEITEHQHKQEMVECLNRKLEQKIDLQTQELDKYHHELEKTSKELNQIKQQVKENNEHSISPIPSKQKSASLLKTSDTPGLVITLDQLNAIFNAAVEGIITIDAFGNMVSINQTAENIFGYRQEDVIGCSINKVIPQSEQSHYPYRRIDDSCVSLLNSIGKIRECCGLHKDGSKIPLEVSIAQFALDGKAYLTAIVRDISVRKLREQRSKEHLDELAHVTRLGLMGELASGIAHEVNQPLTAVVNYANACINLIRAEHYDLVQLTDILSKTSQQAHKAGQIIHRLRDLVKAKKIHNSLININHLIYNAIDLCTSYIKQYDIQLNFELSENIPDIFVDTVQIEQVILNLIKNSIDALSNNDHSYSPIINIKTNLISNKYLEIRISDNGPGIKLTDQGKIFNPFYTTKSSGMGMGLSICRSIIEAHEGEISFESSVKKGTTFYFSLPIRKSRR